MRHAMPELYLNSPEYHSLLATYDPGMRDPEGAPISYEQFERVVRHYIQGKAHRRRYRQSEKGKAVRRERDRKRRAAWRAKWKAHKEEFKNYLEEKRRNEGLRPLRKLTIDKYERKKEYNRDRYRRLAAVKRAHLAQAVKVYGADSLLPSPSTPLAAPGPDASSGLTYLPIGAADCAPLSPELIAWYAARPHLSLPEPNAVDDRGPLYLAQWAAYAEKIPAIQATWLELREHVIAVTAEVRAKGLRVDATTAPSFADPSKPFEFVPLHSFPHQGRGRGEPSWCRFCGCRFLTPLGLRKDVNAEVAWPRSPYRCSVLPDIPDSVFWPSGHPDGLSPPDSSSSHPDAAAAVRPVREPGPAE